MSRLCLSLLVLISLLFSRWGSAAQPEPVDPVVGSINTETITAAEYRLVMARQVAAVYDYFQQTQALEDQAGYWSANLGPESPLAKLRELTREELVRIKVYQGLAKQRGLIPNSDFVEFEEDFARENARRNSAKNAGQVVYGPKQFRKATYYYIRFGDLAYKLKESLAREAESGITESEIEQFYQDNESAFAGKPLDDVLRKRIITALAEKKADRQLAAFCAVAKVEFNRELLNGIVPRTDAGLH